MTFSFVQPGQVRRLLDDCDYEIEAALGDWDGSPLTDDSNEQIWIARRPREK